MKITYIKDLHHNYLVIPADQDNTDEAYCVKMLSENSIDGIIRPEHRIIDGQVSYYFDITSKQSLDVIHGKTSINYKKVKKLFIELLDLISRSYEYLLNEDDLVICPEHIYIELSTEQVHICYLPSYNKDLGKQITEVVEYIMNKLDYKDKEAVLYVYNIYSICKEEAISFSALNELVRRDKHEGPINIETKNRTSSTNNKTSISEPVIKEQNHIKQDPIKQIPIMMEKILEDKEQYYYPLKTYIYTGLCTIGFIIILALSFSTKIVYNSFANRIDYGKLFALILILVCVSGYFMKKNWDKSKRITRIVSREEYVDPRYEDGDQNKNFKIRDIDKDNLNNKLKDKQNNKAKEKPKDKIVEKSIDKSIDKIKLSKRDWTIEDKTNKLEDPKAYVVQTTLLNRNSSNIESYLEPEREDLYEIIKVNDFPFVIGKQKDNVDYWLNNEVVSRYHVKITKDKDIYYITDLNSTNGTSLKEKPLSPYQRYEIQEGDEVKIAGIIYRFRVYHASRNSYIEIV